MERAILSAYLGIPDPKPGDLKSINLKRSVDPEEWDEAKLGIAPMRNFFGGGRLMMENAVARLCLESVQDQLPQFAMWSGDLARPGQARSEPVDVGSAIWTRCLSVLLTGPIRHLGSARPEAYSPRSAGVWRDSGHGFVGLP